jgi:hypothetical protein
MAFECPELSLPSSNGILNSAIAFRLSHGHVQGHRRGRSASCNVPSQFLQLKRSINFNRYAHASVAELLDDLGDILNHPRVRCFALNRHCVQSFGLIVKQHQIWTCMSRLLITIASQKAVIHTQCRHSIAGKLPLFLGSNLVVRARGSPSKAVSAPRPERPMAGEVFQHLLFRGLSEVLGNALRPTNGLIIIQLARFADKTLPPVFIVTIFPITSISNFRRPEDPSLDVRASAPVINMGSYDGTLRDYLCPVKPGLSINTSTS